jgi:glyoxylase-like metal-dependent hydrolase (beta-lactamase superfamily II)
MQLLTSDKTNLEKVLLERFVVGPLQENCYLLADPAARAAVLIDPGDEAPRLLAALERRELALQAIWLTHAHFDHIGALADILDVHLVPVCMHPADEPVLKRAAESAAVWGIAVRQPGTDPLPIADGEALKVGELTARCLHTPGHAPGHVAFYLEGLDVAIAGDALFRGSIGRTDIPFGDHEQLLTSIREKLLTLPPDTVILPGHGPETTVGLEVQTNPFLR